MRSGRRHLDVLRDLAGRGALLFYRACDRGHHLVDLFTRQDNRDIWSEAKALIAESRDAQAKAEAAAFTPKAYPATELLTNEAGP
jgi:hypothetical protein